MKRYNSCPAQEAKMVIRDFNAKIGKEGFINSHAGFHSLYNENQ